MINERAKFTIRRSLPTSISGIVAAAAYEGTVFNIDPSDAANIAPAEGIRGFILERDVVSSVGLEYDVFDKTCDRPEPVGAHVSARQVLALEVEGENLLWTSGTGVLSSSTTVGTELGVSAGRWREKQSGDELAGYLRKQMTAEGDENAFRIYIETVN